MECVDRKCSDISNIEDNEIKVALFVTSYKSPT